MKKVIGIILIMISSIACAICQSQTSKNKDDDTSKTTLYPDANTEYLDENGNKIDQATLFSKVGNGYTIIPDVENGKLKSLKLQKKEDFLKVGTKAPDFSVADINAKSFSLKKLKGKIIILDFWFIHCAGCIMEIPDLNILADKYKADTNIIFIAITYDTKQKVIDFLSQKDFHYNIVPDQISIINQYGVSTYPTSIVIDRRGQIAYYTTGFNGGTDQISKLDEATAAQKKIEGGVKAK